MIDQRGIDLIKDFEGLRLTAYLCPAGIPTIGYGHTKGVTKADVGVKTITAAEAEALLIDDLRDYEYGVTVACMRHPGPFKLAALTSLAFNIGLDAFRRSTVLKAHNNGDTTAAAAAFGMWTKATVNGKKVEMPGLVSRRARETALYLRAENEEDKTPMPQMVEEPTPVGKTGTVAAAKIGTGVVALGTAADVARQASDIAYSATPIMDLFIKIGPTIFFAALALVALGYIWWSRHKQRGAGKL